MDRKTQFVVCVGINAIAQDLKTGLGTAYDIITRCYQIPEKALPRQVANSAAVFVSAASGRSRPFKWMKPAGIAEKEGRK